MDDFTSHGMSPARRRAESLLRTELHEFSLRKEQERKQEMMAAKTARLRELRLAKEAAEKERPKSVRRQKRKR